MMPNTTRSIRWRLVGAAVALALAVAVVVTGACGGERPVSPGAGSAPPPDGGRLSIATGNTTGVYYQLGGAYADLVTSGRETVGAVITVSPTRDARLDILRSWGLVAAGGVAAGAVFVVVALGLTRWILRPVSELDDAAHRISAAGVSFYVPLPGAVGPPELRRLTRSFNEMADSVADVLRRQRDFVSQASHQMRNPLTALILRVEALGDFMTDAEGRKEHRRAIEETERLGRILDGLLALARAARRQQDLEVVDAAVTAIG